jgi:hypothetical protein
MNDLATGTLRLTTALYVVLGDHDEQAGRWQQISVVWNVVRDDLHYNVWLHYNEMHDNRCKFHK